FPHSTGSDGAKMSPVLPDMGLLLQEPEIPNSLSLSRVVPAVYDELRKLARRYMARERAGQTLQATALVNEAYLRLLKEKAHVWQNRAHFCAIAASAMREILVERARARAAAKRGGSRVRISFDNALAAKTDASVDFLALHEALDRLAALDPPLARIVELRFFGGLTVEEAADVLSTSPATIKRAWSMAKSWLRRELGKSRES
ncbi:MAG: polymerase sigma factor, partial [Acidobacteria bacterium]|nr:polymerase sigma factor [Acidobacteriota bacterium]